MPAGTRPRPQGGHDRDGTLHTRADSCLASGIRARDGRRTAASATASVYRLGGRESTDPLRRLVRDAPAALARKAWILGRTRRAARARPQCSRAEAPTAPTLARGGRALARQPRRRRRLDARAAPRRARPRAADPRRRATSTSSRPPTSPTLVAALAAAGCKRETIRKSVKLPRADARPRGRRPEPGPRPGAVKLPREERDELDPPTADHVEAVYRLLPSRAPAAAALARLVGRPRRLGRRAARRRLRRAAPPRPATRLDHEDPHGALGRAARRARRRARGHPRRRARTATRRHALFAGLGADALRTAIAKACRALGDPAVLAARPAPPADLAAAPAGPLLGRDRRVRRAAHALVSRATRTRTSCSMTARSTTAHCSPGGSENVQDVRSRDRELASVLARARKGAGLQPALKPAPPIHHRRQCVLGSTKPFGSCD